MLSSLVAILLSAFTLTAFGAVGRAELTVAVQPIVAAQATEVVKASLVRAPTVPTASAKASPAQPAQAAATEDKPPEVSLEMVLAALALMIVITMRRFRSGPR